MKKIIVLVGLALSLQAMTGFYVGETVVGLNKICYYDTVQGTKAINIASHALCPMNVEF